MGKRTKESWEVYLDGDVIGATTASGARVYQLVIRVRGEGLMGVVKVRKESEYFVNFVGAASISHLAAKVRDVVIGEETRWSKDKFPPT